jgi:Ca-activated chloride channel family protein
MGLAVAGYHLEKSNAKHKVAVIITDGENNAGVIHPETAASMLSEIGISFYVIAVGTAGEVPLDYTDPYTKIRRTGIFDSRYDAESLYRLSLSGGGTFIAAANTESFKTAFSQLGNSEISIQKSRVINRKKSLSFQVLISAIILLASVKFLKRYFLGAVI